MAAVALLVSPGRFPAVDSRACAPGARIIAPSPAGAKPRGARRAPGAGDAAPLLNESGGKAAGTGRKIPEQLTFPVLGPNPLRT